MLQVVQLAALTNKQLCSLAFECQPQTDFPVFSWNVTFPNKPKPTPKPPQPPAVSDVFFDCMSINLIFCISPNHQR